jgi:hypothetical protein
VHLAARYSSPNLQMEGHVTDVSAEGLFFSGDFLDDQGQLAMVSLEAPPLPAPLALRVRVRWVTDRPRAGGMGLELVDPSAEQRVLLASLAPARARGKKGEPGQPDEDDGQWDDGGPTPIPTGVA